VFGPRRPNCRMIMRNSMSFKLLNVLRLRQPRSTVALNVFRGCRRWFLCLGIAGLIWPEAAVMAQAAETPTPAAIQQDLRSFRTWGSVLYIAAHPDDENTLLIAYLARGRDYRTAYLSVTRGDGGQNVLGPDFGAKLGVARTQELLAARRLDGGRQFFTRAMDFGFSKTHDETLGIWDRQQVVADIVRVIRTFRPDVVITRFTPTTGGHGHHSASAILGFEAFRPAGDPKAFPDRLTPWQPKHLFVNGRYGTNACVVQMPVEGDDPVSGLSFSELAGRSRAMHKTQGFGNFGGGRGGGARSETFQLIDGDPVTNDIMDGVETTWARVPGGAEIGKLADEIIAQFNPQNPAASVPALLKLKSKVAALGSTDPVVKEKAALLDHILQSCLGLTIETVIPSAEVVPGETLTMRQTAVVRSGVPVRWLGVRFPVIGNAINQTIELHPGKPATRKLSEILPAHTPISQPYWLRDEPTTGMFRVTDTSLIGQAENPPVFPIEQVFEVKGQKLIIPDQPVQIVAGASPAQARRKLDVIPPVSLGFDSEAAIFAPGASHALEVEITSWRNDMAGTLRLDAPAGWKIEPAKQPFHLGAVGDRARVKFTVTAPGQSATAKILATADVGGAQYSNAREEISYPHIPVELLQPPAAIKAVSVEMAVRSRKIGYLPGAGDSVDDSLKQMGCDVTTLTDEDLTPEKLQGFDAVVIGVRAFNVRTNLTAHLPGLFAYVEAGGTVVAQYNRPSNSSDFKVAPYDLHVSQDRITDETAEMTFLAPDHPVLNTPNKITAADFAGWVQERGIYFPDTWDEHFTPILACHDPGEAPLKGSLLVARYGKGYYVYTGLVFFRELPAGVPGAYRLFANLISLGK